MLDQWIRNSIIRAELRELIVKEMKKNQPESNDTLREAVEGYYMDGKDDPIFNTETCEEMELRVKYEDSISIDQYGGKTRSGGLSPDTGPRN